METKRDQDVVRIEEHQAVKSQEAAQVDRASASDYEKPKIVRVRRVLAAGGHTV